MMLIGHHPQGKGRCLVDAVTRKFSVAAAACVVAAGVSFAVVPASAAPVPVPAAPVQVLNNVAESPVFGGNLDLLALLNNNGTPTASTTIWNPVQFFINAVKQFVALVCYHFTGGGAA